MRWQTCRRRRRLPLAAHTGAVGGGRVGVQAASGWNHRGPTRKAAGISGGFSSATSTASRLVLKPGHERRDVDRRAGIAVASVALAIVLVAIGAYSGDDDNATRYFLIASAVAIVAGVVLFWGIVPRVKRPGLGGLVIGILSVVSLIVFWLGLPSPLAGAAAVLGLSARDTGSEAGKGTVALVLAAVAVVLAVIAALFG